MQPAHRRHPPSLRLIPSKPVPDQYILTCPPAPTVKVSSESSSSAYESSNQSEADAPRVEPAQQPWTPGMPVGSGAAAMTDPPPRTALQMPPAEPAERARPGAKVKQYPALQPNATLPELTYDEMQHRQPLARLSLLYGLGSHVYFLIESLDHRTREDVLSKGLAWVQRNAGDPAIIYRTSTFEIIQQKYHMWPGSSGATHSVTVQPASLEWVRPTAAVAALNVACMHVNNLVAREKPDKTRHDI